MNDFHPAHDDAIWSVAWGSKTRKKTLRQWSRDPWDDLVKVWKMVSALSLHTALEGWGFSLWAPKLQSESSDIYYYLMQESNGGM